MDCIPPGSSVHGISQARILEWVAISFPRTSSWPRDRTQVSCIVRKILYHWATREAQGKYRGTNIYLTVFPFWGKVIFLSHTKCAPSGYSPRALQWHPMLGSFLPASSVTHTFKQGTCWIAPNKKSHKSYHCQSQLSTQHPCLLALWAMLGPSLTVLICITISSF